ncbi:MAG TPA: hypothetical protein DHV85_24995 [Candidatus Accumulibacter sp.]|jgi:hypothetical protein|nr:hypothetical protein [Accumulibacter sp.]
MTRIRILADVTLDGQRHAPDALLDVSPELAAQLVAGGNADDHPDAVAHCLAQGAVPDAIGVAAPDAVDAGNAPKTTRRKKA